MNLPEHGHEFVASVQAERGLSRNTAEAYARDLSQYAKFVGEEGTPSSESAIRAFLGDLRALELADASIARKFAAIRAYHRFLVVEGLASHDPTAGITAPARAQSLPKALTIDQVARIFDNCEEATALQRRDLAILEFLYASGCRVTELVDLDLHDLDLETRTALVTGKGNKQRLVPFGTYAHDALERWLEDRLDLRISDSDSGALFLTARGNRLSRQTVWRIVRRSAVAADIKPERLSPHVLRHSAATHMVEGGADLRTVQEVLGHASLSTTQIYTRVSPEHLTETIIVSHPRGR